MRKYNEMIETDTEMSGELFAVDDFIIDVNSGCFGNYDGSGYWVKNNLRSQDEVFSTPREDATHVLWFSK